VRNNRSRFEESFLRAQRMKLSDAIKKLQGQESKRSATAAQIEGRRRDLLATYTGDPTAANRQLERILKGNDLTDVSYLLRGLRVSRSVGRVVIMSGGRLAGYGTGFLIEPRQRWRVWRRPLPSLDA
jgi:hypothetical protein